MAEVVERDAEEIAAEAYKEQDLAEKSGEQTGEKEATPEKDAKKKPETEETDEAQAEGKEGDQADSKDKDAEEGSDDAAKDEKDGAESKEVDPDKKITEYAEKHSMTYAEAKEDIEKTEEILNQFKNDPAEMARAMRNKDREYHKLKAESEKEKAKKEPVFKRMTDDQFRGWARGQVKEKPEFVEKYREKFPGKSESMSDEAIIEEIVERELMIYGEKANEKETEIKSIASKKREEAISSLSVADRRFIPEVKAMLLETDDASVISGSFDIKDALYWAKGKVYDADIKAAEERGFKRGKENPQIVGTKATSQGSKTHAASGSSGLTEAQKNRAREMFGSDADDEKCFEMFRDSYKDELKKNPRFDPYKD